ncbi:hypothetical protein ACTL6U_08615 [Rhodovibrionaceae bacterium A322]
MLRKFLTLVLPFLLPFLIYWAYLLLARWKARRTQQGDLPGWADAPWAAIIGCGVALMFASLLYFRFVVEEKVTPPQPPIEVQDPGLPAGQG